ncbi:MAG: enoyl-CoA hydratase/isomerase family protein [Pseudomonadales bacterium]|nr:enoyl-CoA hydratase/isomerase family protein [Pseudomonadales bacterium]
MTETGRDLKQDGDVVLIEKRNEGKIWVITMNRPHRMNSLGDGMAGALTDAFEAYRDDREARVAIITGAGEKAFCAGADLIETSDSRQAAKDGKAKSSRGMGRMGFVNLSESMNMWKPTIAAINGFAIAGGFMVAMQCDIRIIADHAKVGIAETRWNMPGAAWMAPLTRQMPLGCALELTMWGDTKYDAKRCYDIGWAQAVATSETLMPTALAYADRMLDMGPRSVSNNKEMVYRGSYMDPRDSQRFGQAVERNLQGMADSVEGPLAFSEKRRPNFTNK